MTPERESQTFELDDLLVRPGTYFNPQTEVVVVVDDSASIDQEVFNMEDFEGADWVLISDEVPVDSDALDTAMERFQTDFRPAPGGAADDPAPGDLDEDEEDEAEDVEKGLEERGLTPDDESDDDE